MMRNGLIVVFALLCLALAVAATGADKDHAKRALTKKTAAKSVVAKAPTVRFALHAKSKSRKVQQPGSEDVAMCKQILNAIFPGRNLGANLRELDEQQALACMCLWSKTTRASALTSAMFRFYSPVPASSLSGVAKALLKAAWKAWSDVSSRGQTNLISRAFMAAYSASAAEGCFNSGGDLQFMCSSLTDRCKLWDCMDAPDGSKWYVSPVGECERSSTFSMCSNAGCRAKRTNACPVTADGSTMCRCAAGTVINTCTCVSRLPQGASSYCNRNARLATL